MKNQRFWVCVGILTVWIGFIFARSLQPADVSGQESLWVLKLLTRILPFRLNTTQVRKMAHFVEFTVLGLLASGLFRKHFQKIWQNFLFAVSLGMFVALCDETIQLFVEGRAGLIGDVWIDSAGVLMGYLLTTVWYLLHGNPK